MKSMMDKDGPITAEMSVLEVISQYPRTEAVFKSYDECAGECLCCQKLFETVEETANHYGLDLVQLLCELNSVTVTAE
ncbi:MAG: hypothetical protein OQK50_00045 [Deltaproteobacteria bacterium]|nr:hypothetical protein [Deltaproteobacteria bacterium]MCW9048703.1 hypothetical protein [Deltaproteobacteria bacterium]